MTIWFLALAVGLLGGFVLGWNLRADFDAGAFRGEPRPDPPATARGIRRAQRAAKLDLRWVLRRSR